MYYMYKNENQHCSWFEFSWQNRHVAINQTFVIGSFSMCYFSFNSLKVIMFWGLAIKGQLNIL